MLIVLILGEGPARYFQLRGRIEGISEKMLAETLRSLMLNGLVNRSETATVPPQVTYSLTSLGTRFHKPLSILQSVIADTIDDVRNARASR
ncbi:transcriptional regulator [Erythrobacter litoralis]|nr:transcriptional regulator [Erythrobacter litoralis]